MALSRGKYRCRPVRAKNELLGRRKMRTIPRMQGVCVRTCDSLGEVKCLHERSELGRKGKWPGTTLDAKYLEVEKWNIKKDVESTGK